MKPNIKKLLTHFRKIPATLTELGGDFACWEVSQTL